MYGITPALLFSFALVLPSAFAENHTLETCLQKDSISCVQTHLYKKLRALLSQDTIDLVGGFRIVRDANKSISDVNNIVEGHNFNELQVFDKQLVLEDLIYNKVFNFFKHRTIKWNMASAVEQLVPATRKLFSEVPKNVKEKFVHYVTEGRGKKKFMRFVFPVIIAFKMTVFTWAKVIYLGVGLIAKKALIVSIVALMIAIFVAIKKHSYKEYRQPYYEIKGETVHSVPYYPVSWPSGGHSVHSGHDSYDLHGSSSSPSHYLAYAAQKPSYN